MQRFTLSVGSPEPIPSIHWGAVLHGMLMEKLPQPWPELLHTGETRPFSQWVEPVSESRFLWHVQVLDDQLADAVGHTLSARQTWRSSHLRCALDVLGVKTESLTPSAYMRPFFLAEQAPRGMQLTFRTPSTHKVQGRFALFPTVELIGRSLCTRFCAVEPAFALADEEALRQVLGHTRISRYALRSSVYFLEGACVTGYTGQAELHFDGPDPLRRLCGVLFGLAEWSGVGVKTALGMGGCEVAPLSERSKK